MQLETEVSTVTTPSATLGALARGTSVDAQEAVHSLLTRLAQVVDVEQVERVQREWTEKYRRRKRRRPSSSPSSSSASASASSSSATTTSNEHLGESECGSSSSSFFEGSSTSPTASSSALAQGEGEGVPRTWGEGRLSCTTTQEKSRPKKKQPIKKLKSTDVASKRQAPRKRKTNGKGKAATTTTTTTQTHDNDRGIGYASLDVPVSPDLDDLTNLPSTSYAFGPISAPPPTLARHDEGWHIFEQHRRRENLQVLDEEEAARQRLPTTVGPSRRSASVIPHHFIRPLYPRPACPHYDDSIPRSQVVGDACNQPMRLVSAPSGPADLWATSQSSWTGTDSSIADPDRTTTWTYEGHRPAASHHHASSGPSDIPRHTHHLWQLADSALCGLRDATPAYQHNLQHQLPEIPPISASTSRQHHRQQHQHQHHTQRLHSYPIPEAPYPPASGSWADPYEIPPPPSSSGWGEQLLDNFLATIEVEDPSGSGIGGIPLL